MDICESNGTNIIRTRGIRYKFIRSRFYFFPDPISIYSFISKYFNNKDITENSGTTLEYHSWNEIKEI